MYPFVREEMGERRVCYGAWCIIVFFVIARSAYLCQGCLKEEKKSLLRIKNDINYLNESFLSYWTGEHCCRWSGVVCNSATSRIVKIDLSLIRYWASQDWYPNASLFAQFKELDALHLSGNQISGFTNSEGFTQLRNLKTLDLSYNKLNDGSLSGVLNMTNLQDLDLSFNNLEDVNLLLHLGNLSMLERLDLSYNNLKGSFVFSPGVWNLPNLKELILSGNNLEDVNLLSRLGNLSTLETLDLGYNKLKGPFAFSPAGVLNMKNLRYLGLNYNNLEDVNLLLHLGNLSMLKGLHLSNNNLTGSFVFSPGICELRTLRWLDLEDNEIEGRIHPCLGNMHSLESLDLGGNRFHGVLRFSMFQNLSNLTSLNLSNNPQLEVEFAEPTRNSTLQLEYLDLSNCKLNIPSGSGIPSFLATQDQLTRLSLSRCHLVGNISSWLFFNTSTPLLFLDLSGNSFWGPFLLPSHNTTSSIIYLDASENSIHGQFPSNFAPCFPQLAYLNMSANALQGQLPSFIGCHSLEILDLSSNKFSGEIPFGLTNHTSLHYLKLSANRLVGNMLPRYCSMPYLKALYLDGNDFSGTISGEVSNMTYLLILDVRMNNLSGRIPDWLPTALSNVGQLLLGNNSFVGHIPTTLCQIQTLHLLDLSHNSLSGNIPSCFNNITSWKFETAFAFAPSEAKTDFATKGRMYTYEGLPLRFMTGIDLSMNQLTGIIPAEIGSLKQLHSLNLSNNLLTGPFPESLENMEQLESLDLSHNKLIGPIPPQIVELHSLSSFSVAFNDLSGPIPCCKGQLDTFDEISYVGNPGLCGKPLDRNCSFNNPLEPHDKEEADEEDEESGVLDNHLFLYSCVAISYALGFWGFIAILIFCKNGRRKYFMIVDEYIDLCRERVSGILCNLRNH